MTFDVSPQLELFGMESLCPTSYREVSPARTSARPDSRGALVKRLEAAFSVISSALRESAGSLGKNHIYCLRTSGGFSVGQRKNLAAGLESFSTRWPRSGTMQSGFVFPLPPLERRTSETVSGLLPTPTKHNSKEGAYPAEFTRNTPTLATHAGGKINPEWSEHLMGFPIKWTELER